VDLARRAGPVLRQRGFALATLQTPWVCERLGTNAAEVPREMVVLTASGEQLGGADGVVHLAGHIGWAWPLPLLGRLPGMMTLFRAGYKRAAARRHCAAGRCEVPRGTGSSVVERRHPTIRDWLPLLLLAGAGVIAWARLSGWILMWGLAITLGLAFKWLTLCDAWAAGHRGSRLRTIGYLFAWPGMNARAFLSDTRPAGQPENREWLAALAKTLLAAIILWAGTPVAARTNPMLGGWTGMTGIVLLLHFGLFHLLSLAWRRAGVDAPPIMRAPLAAGSLAGFWGVRWNRAFAELAHRFVLRPLARNHGVVGATACVYLASGLLHEIVISVPARAGYGLPTTYFLVQLLGLLFERTRLAGRLGLGRGWRGWLHAFIVTAGPVYWLFHPPFVQDVLLPMLDAIGAV
jgi:alginate O-acetyltransferase complex protein AlgI